MSLEAVKKVIEAEKLSQKQKFEGEQAAKRLVEEAEREGKARLEMVQEEAERKLKNIVKEEDDRNASEEAAWQAETTELQAALMVKGRRRLEQAAAWIVRKVVEC